MRRWLFRILSMVSLLLCLASAVLWVRSNYCWDSAKYNSPVVSGVSQLRTTAESALGSLTFKYVWFTDLGGRVETGSSYAEPGFDFASQTVQNHPLLSPRLPPLRNFGSSNYHPPTAKVSDVRERGRHWLGFGHLPEQYTHVQSGVPKWKWRQGTTMLPHWALVLFFGILPLRSLLVARSKRRLRREGICVVCGYDLRASKDRCPECGTMIESPSEMR